MAYNCLYTYNGKSYNEEEFKEFVNKNLVSITYELKDSENIKNLIDPVFEIMHNSELSWINTVFNKFYPKDVKDRIQFLYTVVNSDRFGKWASSGITLYANAAVGTGYHEAWHEFTQVFLTLDEKKSLYAEAIKNVKELNGLDIEDKSDVEKVEEYLANDFMNYMLSDGKKVLGGSPVRNTLFRRILNFIKALFGGDNFEVKLSNMYQNLRVGDLSKYSFNLDNVYLKNGLDRIIPNFDKLDGAKEDVSSAINAVLDTFDAFISYASMKKGISIIEMFRSNELKANMYGYIKEQVDALSKSEDFSKKNRDIWSFVHDNFNEFVNAHREKGTWSVGGMSASKEKELTELIESVTKGNIEEEESDFLGEKEMSSKREEHNKAGNEKTSSEEASKEIKFLIRSLIKKERLDLISKKYSDLQDSANEEGISEKEKVKREEELRLYKEIIDYINSKFLENLNLQNIGSKELYEEYINNTDNSSFTNEEDEKAFEEFTSNFEYPAELNIFGGIQLVDFETTWNLLQKELVNKTTYKEMYDKVVELAKSNIDLIDLVKKLPSAYKGRLSKDELYLAARFRTDLTRVAIPIKINSFVIERDGDGKIKNIEIRNILASNIAIDSAKKKFDLRWRQDVESPYVIIDENENMSLNTEKIKDDFLTQNVTVENIDEDGVITQVKIENENYIYNSVAFKKESEDRVFRNRTNFLKAMGFYFSPSVVDSQDFRDALMGYNTIEDVFVPGIFSGGSLNNVGSMLAQDLMKVISTNEKELKVQRELKTKEEKTKYPSKKIVIVNPIDFFSKPSRLYVSKEDEMHDMLEGSSENINRKLIDLEILHSGEYFNNASFNADGKIQNENSQYNAISTYVNDLNNFEKYPTYQHLIANPELQQFDVNKNPDIRSSLMMNSLFNLNEESTSFGERKRDVTKKSTKNTEKPFVKLELSNYNGLQISDNQSNTHEGGTTVKLSKLDRYITTISNILNDGMSEIMRAGTKSTALSVRPSFVYVYNKSRLNSKSYFDINSDLTRDSFRDIQKNINLAERNETDKLNEIFGKYLLSELERMYKAKKLLKDGTNVVVDSNNSFSKFSTFSGLLSDTTKNKIEKALDKLANKKGDMISYQVLQQHFKDIVFEKDSINILKSEILESVGDYLEKQVEDYEIVLKKAGYSKVGEAGLSSIVLKNNKGVLDKTILRAYMINQFVYNVETAKVFFGDSSFYKAWNKRLGSFLSTGNMPDTSPWMMQQIQDDPNYRLESRLGGHVVRPMNGEVHSVVHNDITIDVGSDVKAMYTEMLTSQGTPQAEIDDIVSNLDDANEPDGIAIMSFDFYRIFKKSIGFWYDAHEEGYTKLINWEKSKRELKHLKAAKESSLSEDPNISEIIESLESKVKGLTPTAKDISLFPMIKIGQAGPIKNNDFYLPSVFKGAMYPILPGMVTEDSNIYNVRNRMLRNGEDYTTFKSTSKVVTTGKGGKLPNFYSDTDSRILNEDGLYKTITYLKYYKEQLQIEPHADSSNSLGTQIRKQLFGDKFNDTVPTDFKGDRNSWNTLAEKEKEKTSTIYRLYKDYVRALEEIKKYKLDELLDEIGVEGYVDGKPETIKIKDYGKFVDIVLKETLKKEAPNSIEYFLKLNKYGKLQYPLEASKDKQLIQEIIMSIVNNRLVDVKMNGSALFQMPETGFELLNKSTKKYDNKLKEYSIKKNADGTVRSIGLEVMISFADNYRPLLKLIHADGKVVGTVDRLNEMMRDEEWYSKNESKFMIFGYRIPSQSMSSAAHFKIKQFLSKETMNVIVLPSIITKINGSDFDIDKLYMIHPFFNKMGEVPTITNRVSVKKALANVEKIQDELENLKKPNFIKSVEEIAKAISDGSLLKDKVALVYNLKYLTEELLRKEVRLDSVVSEISSDFEKNKKRTKTTDKKIFSVQELNEEIEALNSLISDLITISYSYKDITTDKKDVARDVDRVAKENFVYFKRRKELLDRLDYENSLANSQEKILGNSIYKIAMEIMQRGDSFKNIITANNSNLLEEITEFIKENNKEGDYNETPSKTDLMSPVYGAEIYSSFMESKDALGIAALASPLHQIFQRVGAYVSDRFMFNNASYKTIVWLKNNKVTIDGKEYISLGSQNAVNGQSISKSLSEFITAYVDAENKPFIFYMNGGKKLAPVLLYATHQGVTVENAVYLVNQDSVKHYISNVAYSESSVGKYIREQQGNSYELIHALVDTWNKFAPDSVNPLNIKQFENVNPADNSIFYKTSSFYELVQREAVKANNSFKVEDLLSEETLKKRIQGLNVIEGTQEEIDNMNKKVSFYSFIQYIMLEMQASNLKDVNENLKFDTKKTKSTGLSIYKQNKLNDLTDYVGQKTQILPPSIIDKIANESEISPYRIYPVINNLFKEVEKIQSNPKVQQMLKDLLDHTSTTTSSYKIERLVKEYYNDLVLFILQNKGAFVGKEFIRESDEDLSMLLKGSDNNIVDKFLKLRNKYNGINHEYDIMGDEYGSTIFKSLGILDSKRSNLRTLKWKDKKISADLVDSLMPEWRRMASSKKFLDIKNFFKNDLPKATFLSYGELRSMNSFVSLIPVELHAEWATPFIKYFFDNMPSNIAGENKAKFLEDASFFRKLDIFNTLFKKNHPNFFKGKNNKISDGRVVDYRLDENVKHDPFLNFEKQEFESENNEEEPKETSDTEIPVTSTITDLTAKPIESEVVEKAPVLENTVREYTPENITSLKPNEVFVFGSNDRGNHGLGAALTAKTKFGAINKEPSGPQGQSFAVRTKMYQNNRLLKYTDLTEDNKKIMDKMTVLDLALLREEALKNPNKKYYVTEIGTKLAGRTVEQMKMFFSRMEEKLSIPNNVILPKIFEVRNEVKTESVQNLFKEYTGTMLESEFNSLPLQVQQTIIDQQKTC